MGVDEAGGATHWVQMVEVEVYVTVDTEVVTMGTGVPEEVDV